MHKAMQQNALTFTVNAGLHRTVRGRSIKEFRIHTLKDCSKAKAHVEFHALHVQDLDKKHSNLTCTNKPRMFDDGSEVKRSKRFFKLFFV